MEAVKNGANHGKVVKVQMALKFTGAQIDESIKVLQVALENAQRAKAMWTIAAQKTSEISAVQNCTRLTRPVRVHC